MMRAFLLLSCVLRAVRPPLALQKTPKTKQINLLTTGRLRCEQRVKGESINKLLAHCTAKKLLNIQFKPLPPQEPSRVALKPSARCSKHASPHVMN